MIHEELLWKPGHQASHSLCTDQGKTLRVPILKDNCCPWHPAKKTQDCRGAISCYEKKNMHSTFSWISREFPGILNGIFFLLSSLDFQRSSPQLVAAMLHIFQNCNINIAEHDSVETPVQRCARVVFPWHVTLHRTWLKLFLNESRGKPPTPYQVNPQSPTSLSLPAGTKRLSKGNKRTARSKMLAVKMFFSGISFTIAWIKSFCKNSSN